MEKHENRCDNCKEENEKVKMYNNFGKVIYLCPDCAEEFKDHLDIVELK